MMHDMIHVRTCSRIWLVHIHTDFYVVRVVCAVHGLTLSGSLIARGIRG